MRIESITLFELGAAHCGCGCLDDLAHELISFASGQEVEFAIVCNVEYRHVKEIAEEAD